MKRRNFLMTTAGAIALPWMESFSGNRLASASTPTPAAPARFVTLYFPNGVYPSAWQAVGGESGLRLAGSLAPLQPFASKGVVIEGMDHPLSGHLGQTSGFLSGVGFGLDDNGVLRGGTSLDQMLASRWADQTYLPSLNLALEPPSQGAFGDLPRSYGNSISWSSPTSKIEPQTNPQQAFDQVFFGQTAAGRKAASRRKRVVDAVWEQARGLQPRLSQPDRQKLTQYLDSVRDLQAKLDKTLHPSERAWNQADITSQRPDSSGIPSRYDEHMELMLDLITLALQTGSTRVATLLMGHSISRVVYDFVDPAISRNHHDYSHHRNDPGKIAGYNQITTWFAAQAASLLTRMDEVDEGNGSLLDNSVVLFGSCMKDGNVHDPINVPISLFGGAAGRLRTGRHMTCGKGATLAQLHLSLLHLYDINAESFNNVTSQTLTGLL